MTRLIVNERLQRRMKGVQLKESYRVRTVTHASTHTELNARFSASLSFRTLGYCSLGMPPLLRGPSFELAHVGSVGQNGSFCAHFVNFLDG